MSYYDLHDHQKAIVRELARIVQETTDTSFYHVPHSGDSHANFFDTTPRQNFKASTDDLRVLAAEGLIELRYSNRDGRINGGSVRRSAINAAANDFRRPAPAAPVGVYQNFYAPVGAVNSGPGSIVIQKQDVGLTAAEVGSLIGEMRALLEQLPPEQQAEADENLTDLEAELRADVPKQSRVKAYLLSLWSGARQVADFGHKVTAIANAYGIDTSVFG